MTPTAPPSPFSPSALAKLVDALPPPENASLVVLGAVDSTGAQIVAEMTSRSGAWEVQGAYRHEWKTGEDAADVKVIYKW
jgi:hypothetical protein